MSEKSEIKDDGDRAILIACTHKKNSKLISLNVCLQICLNIILIHSSNHKKKTNNENF